MDDINVRGLARDILQNSTTMVGVCMTVIGLVRVFKAVGLKETLVDDALAINSLFFLGSAFFSYIALRFERRNSQRMENIADTLFLTGLTLIVGIAFIFAFSVI